MAVAASRHNEIVRLLTTAVLLILVGCEQRMSDQPKYDALEVAPAFHNMQAAQWPPAGTIPQGKEPPSSMPTHMTRVDIERGATRYDIYCMPCHGLLGNGGGPVVKAGFRQPPSFHVDRLRQAGISHFYEVITHGHGIMYSYADRVARHDRWRIAFYIQALQQSQHTDVEQHPEFQQALNAGEASP